MIDLDSEDGVRDAFKTLAGWYGPNSADVPGDTTLVAIQRLRPARARGRSLIGGAAAAAVLIAIIAVTMVADRAGDPIAAANGDWAPMAETPLDARFAPVSVWTGRELLVWGGHDADGNELVDGAAYDPGADRWRPMSPFPYQYQRRSGVGVGEDGGFTTHPAPGAWIDGKAVFVLSGGEDWSWQVVSYDPTEDRWDKLDEATFTSRDDDTLARVAGTATVQVPYAALERDGRLLVFGWHSERHQFGWSTFDVGSREWSPFTGLPGSGALHGQTGPAHISVVDDRYLVWVINRYFAGNSTPAGYRVDLLDGEAVELPRPERTARVDIAALSSDGTIVGLSGDDETLDRFTARLDPRTATWRSLPDAPSGPADYRNFGDLVAMDDATAFVGGLDIPDYSTGGLEPRPASLVLGPDDRWHDLPKAPIDLSRVGATVAWTGESLVVWGGATTASSGPVNLAVTPLSDGAVYTVPSSR